MLNAQTRQHAVACCILAALLGCFGSAQAEQPAKILVLNSDASVEKYRLPQEEFTQAVGVPVIEINLAEKKWKRADLEELFYDEEPDVVYCIGTKSYLLAQKYAGKTPVVFSSIINWLRLPVSKQIYGVSNELHAGMEMMLFRYIFPNIQTIGVLYSRKYTQEWLQTAAAQGKELGLSLVAHELNANESLEHALKKFPANMNAFWLIPDPLVMSTSQDLQTILAFCDARKIPVFSYHEAFAGYGAALAVSVDAPTIGRQAAAITSSVLAGEQLPERVQFPAGSYITLNLKKITEYNVAYNQDALGSVNAILK